MRSDPLFFRAQAVLEDAASLAGESGRVAAHAPKALDAARLWLLIETQPARVDEWMHLALQVLAAADELCATLGASRRIRKL